MKNFIYYENGWRWFEADQLPIKPILWDEIRTEKYANALSTLKANSLPVRNINEFMWPTDFHKMLIDIGDIKVYEWPGSVDVTKQYELKDLDGIGIQVAILKPSIK